MKRKFNDKLVSRKIVKKILVSKALIFSESLRSRVIYGVDFIYGFSLEVDDVKKSSQPSHARSVYSLTRTLRRKLLISADSSLFRQKIGTFFK